MNMKNLRENHGELLSHLKKEGYSQSYIRKFKTEITYILKREPTNVWQSYADIYQDRAKTSSSKVYQRNMRTIIGACEQFDIYGKLPDGRHRHTLFERGSFHKLIPEFQELILFYCENEPYSGKKASTIKSEAQNTASFLFDMQQKGCNNLISISEDNVLSFFVSSSGKLIKSCSYKKNIAAVFKTGLCWRKNECHRVLSYLPMLREKQINFQYLKPDEAHRLRKVADSESLSLRNRAIVLLLLYTGLRGSDLAAMTVNSIDWEKDRIYIIQQKTDVPLELPLSPVVGNAIFEYINVGRPNTDVTNLFVSENKPYGSLAHGSIGSIMTKVFSIAGVRQNPGDRRGTHIFRHNIATSMLQNGIPKPVITQTLGHTSPNSLEPYLHADFVHLKECALSIEEFPLPEEVLSL